jgi:ABC-type glycerol-3-phosphate transport system permease component
MAVISLAFSAFASYNLMRKTSLRIRCINLCVLRVSVVKINHPPTVLANPYFLDWRFFGQNPEMCLIFVTMGFAHG